MHVGLNIKDGNFNDMIDSDLFVLDEDGHLVFNVSKGNEDLFINSSLIDENSLFSIDSQFNFELI